MKKSTSRKWQTAIAVFLVFAGIIYFSPLYILFINSFKSFGEILSAPASLPKSITFDNFITVWKRIALAKSFKNSIIVTVSSLAGIIVFSSLAAYRITRHSNWFTKLCYAGFIAEMVLPFQVVMIPLVVVLRFLHINNSLFGLIFANIGLGVSFATFTYCGFIKSIPREIEEAAIMDGCSEIRLFWQIVFPLLRNVTATIIIIDVFWIWNDFLLPQIVLSRRELRTVPLAINSLMGEYVMQWDLAIPALVMAILPATLLYIVLHKRIVAGLTEGAIKG